MSGQIVQLKNGNQILTFTFQLNKIKRLPGEVIIAQVELKDNKINPKTVKLNKAFIDFFTAYKNKIASQNPSLAKEAKKIKNGSIVIFDRNAKTYKASNTQDIIGVYEVKEGKIGPFQYNGHHKIITEDGKLTNILTEEPLLTIVKNTVYSEKPAVKPKKTKQTTL